MASIADLYGYPPDKVMMLNNEEVDYLREVALEEMVTLVSASPEMKTILQERLQSRMQPYVELRDEGALRTK